MTQTKVYFFLFALAGLLFSFGCNGNDRPLEAESQTVIDNAIALGEFSAIRDLVDMEARSNATLFPDSLGRVNTRFCTWSTTTIDQQTPSRFTMEVDFGSGTNCQDGRLRTGKLNVSFQGLWNQNGTIATVTPENYTSSEDALEFTMEITCLGENADGQDEWTVEVSNGRIYTAQGPIGWDCEQTFTQIEGQGTADVWDNVYLMEGSTSGTARNTIPFTTTAIEPLRSRLDCRHVAAGISEITPQGFQSRTLDYGAGTCDNRAILTIGDWFAEILLPE